MSEISIYRLYLLRAAYLLIVVGLAFMIWPGILSHEANLPHLNGVVRSLLGAVCLLSIIGIFHPLKMLPLLLFEFVWKSIWLIAFWSPARSAGTLNADMDGSFFDCLFG